MCIYRRTKINISETRKLKYFIIKLKFYTTGVIILMLVLFYFIYRRVFVSQRVLMHSLWEYDGGERICGDFIQTQPFMYFKRYKNYGSKNR